MGADALEDASPAARPDSSSPGLGSMAVNCDSTDFDKQGGATNAKDGSKGAKRGCFPMLRLYRYADAFDVFLMAFGGIFAAGQGVAFPGFSIIYGNSMNASVGNEAATFTNSMKTVLLQMGLLACGVMVAATIWQTCFLYAAERQAMRMRMDYFKKVLTRDITWFDANDPASLPTRMASEVQTIQEGIGAKSGQLFVSSSQFIAGLIVGFVQGWELSLVICAMVPPFAVSGMLMARSLATLTSEKQTWFGRAGAVAEQAFTAVRTVAAFGGEKREAERFEAQLLPARRGGIKAGVNIGISFGLVMCCFALAYALAFWFGANYMIAKGRINSSTGQPYGGADVIKVFFAVLTGIMSLNDMGPVFLTLTQAMACEKEMTKVMEGDSSIEDHARSDEALPKDATVLERLDFLSVEFSYPSRPDVPILRGLSLSIRRGQKVALVGESGSGKSTVIALLERFYDPKAGMVLINNLPLNSLPLSSWRRLIGYVGQEPVLFATTVLENVKGSDKKLTDEDAERALKQAEAWDFLSKLPHGMHTFVGVGGGQMSGGQKQRIAIARALVKKPQLLLLDEATSALDNESEKQVQETIDHLQAAAAEGMTTISIAHRLSTIKNSDVIFVFKAGQVLEQGKHNELMDKKGEYYNLVQSQSSIEAEAHAHHEPTGPRAAGAATGAPQGAVAINVEGLPGQPEGPSPRRADRGWKNQSGGEADAKVAVAGKAGKPGAGANKKSAYDDEKERLKELSDMKYKPPWGRLLRMSRPEWWVVPIALAGALLGGASMPLQGWLFAESTGRFYTTCDGLPIWLTATPVTTCPDAMIREINKICLYFVFVGIGALVGEFMKYTLFTFVQECLVLRLRSAAFANLIRQDVGFFDDPRNGPGGLTTTLARQTLLVSQMTGISLGNATSACLSLCFGLVLGFIGSWKLSLAILAMVPALMVAMYVVMRATLGGGGGDDGKYSVSGEIATEAILNIRTVRALLAEETCIHSFAAIIHELGHQEAKMAPMKGFAFGFGNGIMFTLYLLGFGYGAVLADHGLEPMKMYQSIMCIMLGAMGASFAVAFSGDAAKGKLAAFQVFQVIDRESKVDAVKPTGTHKDLGDGTIEFKDVQFTFPHRPDTLVLRGLSFKVVAGQSVALVGPSGSGKSTVIQLLQRFYDATGGSVLIGGTELRDFDVSWWRRQLGFVGQEPILFDMSLEENVKYGKLDATHEEVLAAAKKANMDYALEGKVSWGDIVGTKGGKLSGGQKQRAAIARALLRNPKVLLLDEATSALDSVSERVVQQALDNAREGRTTFTIAHRLSTIRDCNVILVVASGQIAESGTHAELMAHNGLYANLAKKGAQ